MEQTLVIVICTIIIVCTIVWCRLVSRDSNFHKIHLINEAIRSFKSSYVTHGDEGRPSIGNAAAVESLLDFILNL